MTSRRVPAAGVQAARNGGVPRSGPAGTAAHRAIAHLLHLLAEEAPAEAFDRLSRSVLDATAPSDRDLALTALARAGRVRELLAHRKRREKETQALYESARDLASLRDGEQVLEAIVHRTRQLLGTDAAYLALVDPDTGEVYMRLTLGTVTTRIESVRQRPGQGIGGRIIRTGRPYATANYQADRSLDRDPSVADAVVEDGIVGIIGAPLRVGGDVVGALFGANRYEHSFEPTEVALLCSLADHAAIVIENARLFERAERTAEELRTANAQLRVQGQALERGTSAHGQLMRTVLRRADMAELIDAIGAILEGEVALVDPNGQVVASTRAGHAPPVADPPAAGGEPDGSTTARPGGAHRLDGPADVGTENWAVPVQAGPDSFGHLVFRAGKPLLEADVRILERSAQTAALLLLMERQAAAAEQHVRGEVIADLLAEREPRWDSFTRRAKRASGIDFDVPHSVLVLTAGGVPRRRLLRAAADYAATRRGLASEHAGKVVLLLPGIDEATAGRTVKPQLDRMTGGQVTCGVAGPAASAAAVRELHRSADRCHRLLLALGREGQAAGVEDLGVIGLVLSGTSREQLQQVLAETLGPVVRYDEEHGTPLVETLSVFFSAGQNPRAAARSLRVHPNTVYQRLERVDVVLGHRTWREPQGALAMQMALQLHRVVQQVPIEVLVGA
ncbi:PucR C-terminal helix-turn-helix domain-containing protein [Geodermatophilus ruber]|uniref:PucR C-terminal helix-turn-helix domain-containing protein n=2 Tax=Geodermatophilus ruber TaxID=504800 RepID=A0A1I4AG38_9ACTN|nr:PucR C-terminal helix-turn-helix domain-containing protein [Geodermatophilus ruber]